MTYEPQKNMFHISLFSGIGGFDIASEWIGWTNIVSCEINPFGRKHLEFYWPEAYHHDDIHTLTYEKINEELTKRFGSNWRTDDIILTGGFPCQPYSTAGKRLGKNDERHLWPQMLRVIQEIAPTYIVGENVRGIVNWNGGMVFDEVQTDLEDAGYKVIPFIIPACAVNAPHRRDRVWFVAYAKSSRNRGELRGMEGADGKKREPKKHWQENNQLGDNGEKRDAPKNTIRSGCLLGETEQEGAEVRQLRDVSAGNSNRVCGEPLAGIATNTNAEECNGRCGSSECEWQTTEQRRNGIFGTAARPCEIGPTSDTKSQQSERMQLEQREFSQQKQGELGGSSIGVGSSKSRTNWQNFPTQPPVCSGNDGFPTKLDGITFSKWRNESIKAAGNAIVPQVAYQIFKSIQFTHDNL